MIRGKEIKTDVYLKDDEYVLQEEKDYTVSYLNNRIVGPATVTVTGIGNYKGTISKDYIIAIDIDEVYIDVTDIKIQEYTGNEIVFENLTIWYTSPSNVSYSLRKGIDYIVEYVNNINVGTATMIIIGKEYYTGVKKVDFEIEPLNLANLPSKVSIYTEPDEIEYTGEAIIPNVTVYSNYRRLEEGVDYTIEYQNNINVGYAKVVINGIGNYTGKKFDGFSILAKDLSKVNVDINTSDEIFTENEITKEITVKDGDKILEKGKDYTVSYSNNIDVGMANIEIKGYGNYTGKLVENFKILSKDLSNFKVEIDTSDEVYNGHKIIKDITVRDGDKILEKEKDYTITYEKNTNVGTATVTVTGKGNYNGNVIKEFKIIPRPLSYCTITIENSDEVFNGNEIFKEIKVQDMYRVPEKEIDYFIKYENNKNVGTATITITGKGNYTGTITENFKIVEKDISKLILSLDSHYITYTGEGIKPTTKILDSNIPLELGKDYTVEYQNNINVGKAKVFVNGIGNYVGTLNSSFEIMTKNIADLTTIVDTSDRVFTGENINPIVNIKHGDILLIEDKDYTVEYFGNINVGIASIRIFGIGNYAGMFSRNFQIKSKNIENFEIIINEFDNVYDGGGKRPTVIIKDGDTILKDNEYSLEYSNNINAGIATITINGIGNYTGIQSVNFEIEKAVLNNNYCSDYEIIYNNVAHSFYEFFEIPNCTVKYSVNNTEYNLSDKPYFKDVGEYTINYKVTKQNYIDLFGSNKVRIYGIKGFDSTLVVKNNMLLVKNYNNSFQEICNRINIYAKSSSFTHYDAQYKPINNTIVKTGEFLQLYINDIAFSQYMVSVLADVNGDGKISALDYVKIKNHIMKTNLISSDVYLTAADVNDDGKISALDYVRIKNYIMNGGV